MTGQRRWSRFCGAWDHVPVHCSMGLNPDEPALRKVRANIIQPYKHSILSIGCLSLWADGTQVSLTSFMQALVSNCSPALGCAVWRRRSPERALSMCHAACGEISLCEGVLQASHVSWVVVRPCFAILGSLKNKAAASLAQQRQALANF
jgi:hypothetical protein